MNLLYSTRTPLDAAPRRWTTMAASAALHASMVAVLFYVAGEAGLVAPRAPRALTFVSVLPAPLMTPPLHLRPVVKEAPKLLEPEPVKIEVPRLPEPAVNRVQPAPPVEEARPAVPDRPKPAPPVVTVGAFALNGPTTHAQELSRAVSSAGFDAPAARAPEINIPTAAVGAFDQSSAHGRPQPGTDQPHIVADAGFGAGVAGGSARPMARIVDAGFGGGSPTGPARPPTGVVAAGGFNPGRRDTGIGAQASQAVKATDFDARAAQPAVAQPSRQGPINVPLEIVSKPTPAYTDEARALRIEGEVLLEVEFTATGDIHVMRIVRGLGHGLDESAVRAVQGMRFKPAQRNGQPIDVRTTVNIVFRLA